VRLRDGLITDDQPAAAAGVKAPGVLS
jgi:hypothetical protein